MTVVERGPVVGGLCGSFQSHGFTLDHGPHKLYSVVPGILDEIRALLGDRLIEHTKKNRIRLLGRFMSYPLSMGNLLPLLGPVRAAGLGASYAAAAAGGSSTARNRSATRTTSCAGSAAASTSWSSSRWPARSGAIPRCSPRSWPGRASPPAAPRS